MVRTFEKDGAHWGSERIACSPPQPQFVKVNSLGVGCLEGHVKEKQIGTALSYVVLLVIILQYCPMKQKRGQWHCASCPHCSSTIVPIHKSGLFGMDCLEAHVKAQQICLRVRQRYVMLFVSY